VVSRRGVPNVALVATKRAADNKVPRVVNAIQNEQITNLERKIIQLERRIDSMS
jgi:hypothetical protein